MISRVHQIQRRFPRLSELRDLCITNSDGNSYFTSGDDKLSNPLKAPFFEIIEADLSYLDEASWDIFKKKLLQRASQKDRLRGWQQFFDTLNEAKGYAYLYRLGYKAIKFIPEDNEFRTPDLSATHNGTVLLCEVKTINVSDFEAKRFSEGRVGSTRLNLPDAFMEKLASTISNAVTQIESYNGGNKATGIAYICINFDDRIHEYAEEYREQIIAYLGSKPCYPVSIELDIKPRFHAIV